jgi:branched-chain amino acid transport system substrate-binding protein
MAIRAGLTVTASRLLGCIRGLGPVPGDAHGFRQVVGLATLGILFAAANNLTHAQAPIRIAGSLSITGTFAELGKSHERGYRVCLKQFNERGGVLGRKVEFSFEDDESQAATAAGIYEKLLSKDKPDAVFSPYSSPLTEAVANVTEKYRMPMVAAGAATTAIFKKGRKYIFMLLSPAEVYLEGLVDVASKRGLKTIAILYEKTLFPTAIAQGTIELAKKRGLQVVLAEAYPPKTTDFSALLNKVKAANPDVVGAATYFNDSVAIIRQMQQLDINPRMAGVTVGGDLPKFYETLGRAAEFVYGASQWEPELVTLRAGGLIPIARLFPGAREFVEEHERMFPGAGVSYQTAGAFGACQVLLESINRAGSLDREKTRDAILKFDGSTVFGAFKVDEGGFQTAHKMQLFQWQDGKKVIIWPEDIAPGRPRFPTPPWSQRK